MSFTANYFISLVSSVFLSVSYLIEFFSYLFFIKLSDKLDLLIESELGVIGIEMTTFSSTEKEKDSETN
jgi:hypothetical protein